jgi:hypothetical protein
MLTQEDGERLDLWKFWHDNDSAWSGRVVWPPLARVPEAGRHADRADSCNIGTVEGIG